MALSQGSKILWSDIQATIDNIITARNKMGYTDQSTLNNLRGTTQPLTAQAATINTMYSKLYECNGRSVVSGNSTVTNNWSKAKAPSVGSLISLTQINAMKTIASTISGLNFAYFSGCFGFSQFNFGFSYFSF